VKRVSDSVAEAIMDNVEIIQRDYKALGYSLWLPGIGDYLEIVYSMLTAFTTKELVERRLLPKMPEVAPPNWAVWAWEFPWTLDVKAWWAWEPPWMLDVEAWEG
jgi:hypothetical protein